MTEGSRPLLAAAWMTGAIISFSSMAVAGRAVSHELDTFELMMYRSLIGLVLVLAFGLATGTIRELRSNRLGLHFIRNICHFAGQNLWFYALTLVTLSQVFALEFTSPIWVMVLAAVFLGERLSQTRLLAVGLGFLGALIVARPGTAGDPFGLAIAAGAAIGFAGSIVSTKLLTRTETIISIMFWMALMQLVLGLITAGWDGDIAVPTREIWPWVFLIALTGLLAHTCLTNALSVAPATLATPMDFLRLPVIAIVGMLWYDEALNGLVFVGAALIFAGNYLNIWAEARRKKLA
ncbi:MAG: DMT family transporter [Boseongicola sp.]